jgi:DNA-binding Xre family transcriptional regulator
LIIKVNGLILFVFNFKIPRFTMINYNFDRIFKARGVDKPFTYLTNAGFSDNYATKIKNNKIRRIGLKELEKLCILLRCTPNDFYEWIPENEEQVDKVHPLNVIRKSDKVFDLTKTLNSVPLGELDELEELINQTIKSSPNKNSE